MKRLRYWQKVLLSNESHICLYHTDGRAHVRRLPGERSIGSCVQGTVAGEVVWVAFSANYILDLRRIEFYFKFPKVTEQDS